MRELRTIMTIGERARLNSPIAARQRVEKLLKKGGNEAKERASPLARYKHKIVQQDHEIHHLKEQLASAERDDGSLFDLKHDTAEQIATVIVGHGKSKAKRIADAITKMLKVPVPAG